MSPMFIGGVLKRMSFGENGLVIASQEDVLSSVSKISGFSIDMSFFIRASCYDSSFVPIPNSFVPIPNIVVDGLMDIIE